jgi:hypothetical protein
MPLEIITGVVVGAAVASSPVRKAVRRGLIYGLGGAMIAYDKICAAAHGAVEGVRKGVSTAAEAESQSQGSNGTVAASTSPEPQPASCNMPSQAPAQPPAAAASV